MASTTGVIVGIIVVMIAGILIIGIQTGVIDVINDQQEKGLCKNSVRAHKTSVIAGVVKTNDIICPTNLIKIDSSMNDDEAKNEIANAMYTCWDNFLRGQLDLFGAPTTYCSICSVIQFTEKDRELDGIYSYVETTSLKEGKAAERVLLEHLAGSENIITYADFLNIFKSPRVDDTLDLSQLSQSDALILKNLDFTLTGDRSYAVIFRYAKGQEEFEGAARFFEDVTSSIGYQVMMPGSVKKTVEITSGARQGSDDPFESVGSSDFIIAQRLLSNPATRAGGRIFLKAAPILKPVAGQIGSKIVWPVTIVAAADVFRVATISSDREAEWMAQPILIDYTEQGLAFSGCEYIPTLQDLDE